MQHATCVRICRTTAWVVGLTLVLGCSSGGGDGDVQCADPFSMNLAGDWAVSETYASNQPDCTGTDAYGITLAQDGGQLIWTKPGAGSVLMDLCGQLIQIPAEARLRDQGLVLRIDSFGARFDSETRFTGTASFALVVGANGSVVCSGTVGVEGIRQ